MYDTHTHINKKVLALAGEVEESIKSINEIAYLDGIINVGLDVETSKEAIEIATLNDKFYATLGIHPNYNGQIEELKNLYNSLNAQERKKIVAVGETGIDIAKDGALHTAIETQIEKTIDSIKLANELNLPVIIHSNNANRMIMDILRVHTPKNGFVFHCYQPDLEYVEEIIKLGGYFGFDRPITSPKADRSHKVIKKLKSLGKTDRILLELDYPFLSQDPIKDGKNVYRKVMELLDLTYSELNELCRNNTVNLFTKIPKKTIQKTKSNQKTIVI